ncbi:MAG TPA: hypothetical protein VMS98_09615 [Thermoanaerobaculia bacterium]|nr:hypothetical protein [Thermoanaerobaculia bacterium]
MTSWYSTCDPSAACVVIAANEPSGGGSTSSGPQVLVTGPVVPVWATQVPFPPCSSTIDQPGSRLEFGPPFISKLPF